MTEIILALLKHRLGIASSKPILVAFTSAKDCYHGKDQPHDDH